MQDQLKERLTGAAILVVVVVLAVPEMFRGRPGAVAPSTLPPASAVPLRTYTLVAGDSPAATPPQGMASAPGATAPADAVPVPGGQRPAADESPLAVPSGTPAQAAPPPAVLPPAGQSASAPVASAPVSAPQHIALQQAAPQQAATPAPKPAAARPAPGKAATARPASARPTASGSWVVQVGSFRSRELAERMVREVHAKGFKVHVVGPDARGLYRVRSGLQPDRDAALALKQQMVARGLKPIVNASP